MLMRLRSGNQWLVAVVFMLFALLPCGASERGDFLNAGEEGILQVNYTVGFQSVPIGLTLEIDGIEYISPVHFVWPEGEIHNITAPSPQIIDVRSRYLWSWWSDYGARSHTIVVMGDEDYTAYYDAEHMVNVTTSPAALDISIDGLIYSCPINTFWWAEGSTHELEALLIQPVEPKVTWPFLGWNDGVRLPKRTVVVNGPATYIAMYAIIYLSTEFPEPPISEGPVPGIGG